MDIFKIVGKIALDGTDEFNRDINSAKSKGASLAGAIGKGLVQVTKVGAAILATASSAVALVGKTSLDAYADFEQLAGGMEKIFDDMDTSRIMLDASEAYKALNMSANEYLAVINDVGASFASTMGDAAGYEAAKTGLTAIADYASGTGKNLHELQEKFTLITRSTASYQSIADQFSGILPATSAAFLEQAKAAGILSAEYKSLTDVPIEEYQMAVTEMLALGVDALNLTGNTAAEATETISGSLAMTRASWKNLLVGFADDTQDLDILVDNFVFSITAAAKNIVPRLAQILGGISDALADIIPVISEELPGLVAELLPGIIKGAGALIQGLVAALPGLLVVLKDALVQIVSGIWDYVFIDLMGTNYDFTSAFSDLTSAAEHAWSEIRETWDAIGRPIWDSITSCVDIARGIFEEKMPEISGFVSSAFSDISAWWNDSLQPCLQAIGDFIDTYLAPVFEAVFATRLAAAVEAGFQFISDMWNNVLMPVLNGITDFLTGVFTGNWELAFEGLKSIFQGWSAQFETIWNAVITYCGNMLLPLAEVWLALWDSFTAKVAEVAASVSEWWEQIKATIAEKVESALATVTTKFDEIKNTISSRVNDARSKVEEAFEKIATSIKDAMEEAKENVRKIWEDIKGVFADAVGVGQKIVDDIKEGIANAWDGLASWFRGIWDGLFGNLTTTVTVNQNHNVSGTNGSHADGLGYVPFDGYIAELHRGEMVVPALEASLLRNGSFGSVATAEIASILTMILDAIQEGNNRDTVFTLNNREFARAVRGVASV